MKNQLLIIDPQNDFCDKNGSLYVKGADSDMERLSELKTKNIDQIHVTLDSHRLFHIAHPIFWVNNNGEHPAPFTIITKEDIWADKWRATNKNLSRVANDYVTRLSENGKHPLCIWPPHCLIGEWGHNIYPVVASSLRAWEINSLKSVNIICKGSNPTTEHYSALKAEISSFEANDTLIDYGLLGHLDKSETLYIAGEALSHCVANTVIDLIEYGINPLKIVILKNVCSNVAGFENLGEKFVADMNKIGVRFLDTNEVKL